MINLSVENICVKYPKKTVLNGISTSFEHSKIHMLIGENGAGKSTLTKVICGDILPDSGRIFINNREMKFKSPCDAIKNGIVCVHQRPLLADSISIIENLKLGVAKFNRNKVVELLDEWLPDIKPSSLLRNFGGDVRFFVSLIGALLKNPSLLILDEPSALLDLEQRNFLFSKLKQFAADGMNIIIITHYMQEAKNFGDTITYLEDGKICKPKEDFFSQEVISETFRQNSVKSDNRTDSGKAYLAFKNINTFPVNKPSVTDFSFIAKQGEITLIEGLVEDGRETLENFICGMENCRQNGELEIYWNENKKIFFKIKNGNFTRRKLEKSPFIFGIIPSNKTFRGSNPKLSIFQLLTASSKLKKQHELEAYANRLIKNAKVNITLNEKAACLSGGMLQRLLLERELEKNPEILILCEPVQGLDSVSSKKLCDRLTEQAQKGKIILVLSSSEFPENICHKIYRLEKNL